MAAARDGDRRALAQLLTMVERGGDHARAAALAAQEHRGEGYTVGLTGAPGSGKSTLASALVHVLRRDDRRVAVLAIDPSSPFSGGALLGDRIRMGDHDLDPGVFIRSMATRGHLGGLALAVPEAVRLLTAAGFELVLLETVGVGQVEVEVAGTADTTVVVLNPGWGDRVQANKAGLMEIADVFVVNKADRDGATKTRRDLAGLLKLRDDTDGWRPPVLATVGTTGEGVEELCVALAAHRTFLEASGQLAARRRRRGRDELRSVLVERLRSRAEAVLGAEGVAAVEAALDAGEIDPYTAADRLLDGG
ncbi:MAG TPA: methylmalonyl Co-A mutase-associated GTPase MeaB [Acidimicrobiales bacterium]|nr:methylmalonyl Co-A mutase-associated GTPase MeaB [Acidimicrobiales bacterium]